MRGELAVSSMKRWNFYTLITFLKVRKKAFQSISLCACEKRGLQEAGRWLKFLETEERTALARGSPGSSPALPFSASSRVPRLAFLPCLRIYYRSNYFRVLNILLYLNDTFPQRGSIKRVEDVCAVELLSSKMCSINTSGGDSEDKHKPESFR